MIPFWRREKRREHREKERLVLENGGIFHEKLITTFDGKRNPIRNFSSNDLKLATNNYHPTNVIMDWGPSYKMHKGFLQGRQISVMKFESDGYYTTDMVIHDIVFASQMRHKNILVLIGCCLETPIPVLVFEPLIKCGTLRDHIHRHDQPHLESLSWRQRLKIAMEIANAFAYLHVGFPRTIVYSYISPSRFFLDEHCVPKLFDFSFAQCIPKGETQIKDAPVSRGDAGFFAPEHLRSHVLNEKSDVYGFGVLLLVLLTGQKIIDLLVKYGDRRTFWNEIIGDEMQTFIESVDPVVVRGGVGRVIQVKIGQPWLMWANNSGSSIYQPDSIMPLICDFVKCCVETFLCLSMDFNLVKAFYLVFFFLVYFY